jgi:hypothetical protein
LKIIGSKNIVVSFGLVMGPVPDNPKMGLLGI